MTEAQAKPGTDWDRITAISAVMIGLVAVAVSAYTAVIQRQQVRAQVWPRLMMYSGGSTGEFGVANRGVGPAIVKSVRVDVDGKPVHDWKELYGRLRIADADPYYNSLSGQVFSAGQDMMYLRPSTREHYNALRAMAGSRFGLVTCYCSTLGECWTTQTRLTSLDDQQRAVKSCPASGPGDFNN
ncbi:MAG TPA: hypothetical protein VJ806_01765 [Luteimonas sp.]|nr:hypothetical protein [Luteimonas sp.]